MPLKINFIIIVFAVYLVGLIFNLNILTLKGRDGIDRNSVTKEGSDLRKMINIINILRKHFKRLTKYAMVGTSGFVLDVTLLFCFTQFVHIWYVASEILATLITFVTNYIGNTIFTYRDAMKKLNEDKRAR
jgi:multisubunit Na+/H+ antiporter MnhG subunit